MVAARKIEEDEGETPKALFDDPGRDRGRASSGTCTRGSGGARLAAAQLAVRSYVQPVGRKLVAVDAYAAGFHEPRSRRHRRELRAGPVGADVVSRRELLRDSRHTHLHDPSWTRTPDSGRQPQLLR